MSTANEKSGSSNLTTVTCTQVNPPVQAVIQVMSDGQVIVRCPYYQESNHCRRDDRGSYTSNRCVYKTMFE